ncbi:J domain-containing protein [Clostridium beijerinckii]|uniref:J domain-containing protein n=1 Tax=Clostridium beijerinckii TaxID=1520 RepID=UPI00232B7A51|nr:J domain-containing protein [Clostridium beijerinckii]
MNWWNVLEIPYDSDIKTIKKAYSRLLKIYNPEDDPEGYQKLREAYDSAIKYAKKNNKNQKVINNILDENIVSEVEGIEDKEYISESYLNEDKKIDFKPYLDINKSYHSIKEAKFNLHSEIAQFLNRLNDIYEDLHLRCDAAVWDELLNSAVIWNVEAFSIIEEELFNFLIKHKYLPAEIWTKLNNNFTWSQNEIKLYDEYPESMVYEVLKKLKEPSELKYDFIKSINPEIADEYLYEREQAEQSLENKKHAEAYNHIKNANSLFEGDAELLRLKGDYNYDLDHLKAALEYYKSAFEINNNDLSSALRIGIILVSYKSFSEALPYLRMYLSCNNENKLALNYIACAYYYNEDFIMAKEYFQKLLCLDENNKIIKNYLKNIEAQLAGKHVRKIIFNRDNLIIEESKKGTNTGKESNMKSRSKRDMVYNIKYAARIIVIIVILFGVRHSIGFKNSSNYNNTQNNKTYENINKDNKKVENDENKNKQAVKSFEKSILDSKKNSNVTIDLYNVKATKYYKTSEPFGNKSIFSDIELQKKGLRDKVESQLYIGSTKENVVIFSDAKCNDKTIDKNGGYRIYGAVCAIDEEIGNEIKNENISDYAGVDWISNAFLDASQTKKNSKK